MDTAAADPTGRPVVAVTVGHHPAAAIHHPAAGLPVVRLPAATDPRVVLLPVTAALPAVLLLATALSQVTGVIPVGLRQDLALRRRRRAKRCSSWGLVAVS